MLLENDSYNILQSTKIKIIADPESTTESPHTELVNCEGYLAFEDLPEDWCSKISTWGQCGIADGIIKGSGYGCDFTPGTTLGYCKNTDSGSQCNVFQQVSDQCECVGGDGYGNECTDDENVGLWCYLENGLLASMCQGAILSEGGHSYWSTEPCKVDLDADRNGIECWNAGCSGNTGEVCDWCGLHFGQQQICCNGREGYLHNHPNCDNAQFNSDIQGHQCVVKPGLLGITNLMVEPSSHNILLEASWCTHTPDHECYPSTNGHPACCQDGDDTCPEEKPECEGLLGITNLMVELSSHNGDCKGATIPIKTGGCRPCGDKDIWPIAYNRDGTPKYPQCSISTDKTTYYSGETISVQVSAPDHAWDWVGIYKVGVIDQVVGNIWNFRGESAALVTDGSAKFPYVDVSDSGETTWPLPPGDYYLIPFSHTDPQDIVRTRISIIQGETWWFVDRHHDDYKDDGCDFEPRQFAGKKSNGDVCLGDEPLGIKCLTTPRKKRTPPETISLATPERDLLVKQVIMTDHVHPITKLLTFVLAEKNLPLTHHQSGLQLKV